MEPICIVRSSRTKAMDRELYWTSIFYHKKSLIKMIVSTAILLFLAIYLVIEVYPDTIRYWEYLGTDTQIIMVACAIIYGTGLFRAVFQAHSFANNREKERRKILGDKPPCSEFLFYSDRFLYRSNTTPSENWIVYAGVKKVKETAHLYIIITEDNIWYNFDKRGFVKGSWEQVLQLLGERVK